MINNEDLNNVQGNQRLAKKRFYTSLWRGLSSLASDIFPTTDIKNDLMNAYSPAKKDKDNFIDKRLSENVLVDFFEPIKKLNLKHSRTL